MTHFEIPPTIQVLINIAVITGAYGFYCGTEILKSVFSRKKKPDA